jgi:hypothetical protein
MDKKNIWLDVAVNVEVDVDQLVKEFGPKATTDAFLIEYAKKNYSSIKTAEYFMDAVVTKE